MVLVTKPCKKISVLLSGKAEVIVYRKLSVYKKKTRLWSVFHWRQASLILFPLFRRGSSLQRLEYAQVSWHLLIDLVKLSTVSFENSRFFLNFFSFSPQNALLLWNKIEVKSLLNITFCVFIYKVLQTYRVFELGFQNDCSATSSTACGWVCWWDNYKINTAKIFLLDSVLPLQTGSFDSHCGVVNHFL